MFKIIMHIFYFGGFKIQFLRKQNQKNHYNLNV